MGKFFKQRLNVFGLLLLIGFIGYGVVLNGPMLFDDEHFIQQNVYVHAFDISKIYSTSVTDGSGFTSNFYRPNQQLVFAAIYHIAGENPIPYHLLQLLIHVLNAFLIFIFLQQLKFGHVPSFVASVFFLIHPVQTEAVSYISGLADPLSLMFMLGGLIAFLRSFEHERLLFKWGAWFALSVLCLIWALFSKESAVVFLPLVFVLCFYLYTAKRMKTYKPFYKYLLVYGIIVMVYMVLKFSIFNFTEHGGLTSVENVYTQNLHVRLITFISILIEYAKMIFFPVHLFYEKPYLAYTDVFNTKSWFGILILMTLVYLFIKRDSYPVLFLGLGVFFAGLLPFTGIVPLNAMFLEHWLYVPLVGLSVLVAHLTHYAIKRGKSMYFIMPFIVLIVLYTARTYSRNLQWANIEKFYLNELNYTDSSIRIFNNLGMYYSNKNLPDKAIKYYRKAIATDNTYPHPHHNIGNLYMDMGLLDEAIVSFGNALQINPDFVHSLNNLHNIYIYQGRNDKAELIMGAVQNCLNGIPNDWRYIQNVINMP